MTEDIRRIETNGGCCSKKQIFLRLNFSFNIKYLNHFIAAGFKSKDSYTTTGLVYLESKDFVVIGPLGGNQLRVKCKTSDCLTSLSVFESIIKEMKDESKPKIPQKEDSKNINNEETS